MEKKVWYVTGASKGLGLALINHLLAAGHRVAAASKYLAELVSSVSKTPDAGFLPLAFDAAGETGVARSIRSTWETFGHIDTVVINASYDAADPSETAAIIRNVLPWFRTQGSGHIVIVGLSRLPVQYTRYENIYITNVLTGALQPVAGGDAAAAMTIPIDGKQIGDPKKAAAALVQMAGLSKPPTHLYLASHAGTLAAQKIAGLNETIKQWEARSILTTPDAFYGIGHRRADRLPADRQERQ